VELKEEALDRTQWRNGFGGGDGPVIVIMMMIMMTSLNVHNLSSYYLSGETVPALQTKHTT
jgi:hypothetical protein